MIAYENQCVDCGLPCLGNSCPHRNVQVVECDTCHDYAQYNIDGEDFCEKCARKMLAKEFLFLSIIEQADALDYTVGEYL